MPEGPLRLFVAVPLPAEAIEACATVIDEIRRGPLGRVPRWVHVPNLHLTVRFLGEAVPASVGQIAAAMERAVGGTPPFDVVLAGAGWFPEAGKPRALWLGIEEGAGELGALARGLDAELVRLGWTSDDRPYRPHLTVARLDASSRADGHAVAQTLRAAAAEWRTAFIADEVVLFRSHLGGGSPRYERLHTLPLT